MFLATTADERFWDTSGRVLFLGRWCLLVSRREAWRSLPHEVLPYHWDDRARLYADSRTIEGIYERTLEQLSGILNGLHGESHPVRYWRIVIGPWLNAFIGILYDRYLSICTAEVSGKVTGTRTAAYAEGQWVPGDFAEFSDWFSGDVYNHYLYGRIIEHLGTLPYERQAVEESGHSPATHRRPGRMLLALASRAINACGRRMPSAMSRVVLESPFLNIPDLLRLQLALGQFPRPYAPLICAGRTALDRDRRSRIGPALPDDRFSVLLKKLLPDQIPQCHIETYGVLKQKASARYPRKPQVILTANAHVHNEGFKVWAASCQEDGASFVGAQHGGFEGMGKWYALEDHQKKVWDRYYTWGWGDGAAGNIRPLPAFKLIPARKAAPDRNGRILMVNNAFMRYAYYLQSMPVGASGYEAYLSDIFEFLRCLEDGPRDLMTVRLYPHDYGYSQRERFTAEFPHLLLYQGGASMLDQMRTCRLFIGNNNTTAYLEAFAAGVPTVLFWNPDHWEVRGSARPYFDELQQCGILHDSPRSAADLVNRIHRDPFSWWEQPGVRKARTQFCGRFARTSDTWLQEWKQELQGLLRGGNR